MEDLTTATQLDELLKKLVDWNQANGKKNMSLHDAKLHFPEFSDIDLLFRILGEYKYEGNPIVDFYGSKTGMEIYINAYTKSFVKNGGFRKGHEQSHSDIDKITRRENLEIELMQLEIINLKSIPRQVKFNRIIAYITILISVASIIISVYFKDK